MTDSGDDGIERDDLGREGESLFEYWCSSLRWIAQRSTCDRRGFDFLVHIPAAAINDDLKEDVVAREEHLIAVQIKSTGCGKMPGLSLTNLRHLVEHPGPSLVVLMEIDRSVSPWRVFQARLLHLDQKWVEEAVRYIWTLEVGIAPGKSSLTLSSADMLVLDSPDAASFRGALQKLNISDPDTYIRNKENQRQKAGRSENPLTGNFTVNLTDPRIEEVIEWSVGLRSSAEIPVERSQLSEERFGLQRIISSSADHADGNTKVEVKNTPGVKYGRPCRLVFGQGKIGNIIEMPAEVYHARSAAPFLPESRNLVRIAALGFDIRFNPHASGDGKRSCLIQFPPDETPLRDCIPIARLIVLSGAGDPVRVRLILDNSPPGALATEATVLADVKMNPSEKLLQLAHCALRAQRLAQLAGLSDGFPMYREELEAQAPTLQLLDGVALLNRESGTFLEVPMPVGFKAEELESLAVLMPLRISLGGQWLLAITSTEGTFQLADISGVPTIFTKRARQRLVTANILIGDIDQQVDTLCEVLSGCVARLEADGYCVVSPDRGMCAKYVQPAHAGDEQPDSDE